MPKPLPHFSLTHGQVLWALSLGAAPDKVTMERLEYMRRLGVPFPRSELGTGRGNPVRYGYDQLIETGVALFGLRRGMRPRDAAEFLVSNREDLRRLYREAYLELPDGALEEDWVKSRGRTVPVHANGKFVRMHERFRELPLERRVLTPQEVAELRDVGVLAEIYPGEETHRLLPLSRLVLEWVAWAQEAPTITPGPK
jgi:hypothetical protein